MKKFFSIFLLFISICAFAHPIKKAKVNKEKLPANTQVWTINAERAQCEGVTTMQCLLVKKQGQKTFEFFYDKINGFDYQEGFTYVIWVKEEMKTPPIPADASIYNYILVKVVSKKSVFGKVENPNITQPKQTIKKGEITDMPKSQTTTLIVNEEKTPCDGNPDAKCLLIKKPNAKTFEIFYQGIKGFTFEEGYRQTILVKENPPKNPMVKQVEPIYTLIEVVKKELIFTPEKVAQIPAAQESNLDKKWILRKMKDTDSTTTLIDDDGVYMELKTYENKVTGKAPCNTFVGGLTTDKDSTFQVVAIANTKMYCEHNMKFESLFFTLLQNAERFEIVDHKLYLYKGKRLLLVFE